MGEYRRGQREGRPAWYAGFPRWRKRRVHDSYQADNGRGNVGVAGWLARLPRVGWLRMRDTLRFSGEPIIVVVANDGIRRYVTIGVYTGRAGSPKRDGEAIGFYMEVRTLATLSDGTVEENPRALASALLALRRADRAIARSRNTCGHSRSPNRRNRLYTRRRRLQVRIAYLRHDFQHKATTAIAKRYARIGVETLNVSGMMRTQTQQGCYGCQYRQVHHNAGVRVRTVLSETHQGGPLVCKLQCPLGLWQPEGGDARLSLPCLRTGDGS